MREPALRVSVDREVARGEGYSGVDLLGGMSACADDAMSRTEQHAQQSLTDEAAKSCQEYIHRESFSTVRNEKD